MDRSVYRKGSAGVASSAGAEVGALEPARGPDVGWIDEVSVTVLRDGVVAGVPEPSVVHQGLEALVDQGDVAGLMQTRHGALDREGCVVSGEGRRPTMRFTNGLPPSRQRWFEHMVTLAQDAIDQGDRVLAEHLDWASQANDHALRQAVADQTDQMLADWIERNMRTHQVHRNHHAQVVERLRQSARQRDDQDTTPWAYDATDGVTAALNAEHYQALADQAALEGRSTSSLASELLRNAIDHLHDCAKDE